MKLDDIEKEWSVDSIINNIIRDIVSCHVQINRKERTFPSSVLKKIEYNNLQKKRRIVLDYKSYSSQIEKAYLTADEQVINGKDIAFFIT